jgi:hypothetical protein
LSIPADTIKGAYKELQKMGDARLEEHIMKSRVSQGEQEVEGTTEEEMDEVVKRWTIIEQEAKQPHLNRAQTLAHNLSWKIHGQGKVKIDGKHSAEEHHKSEPAPEKKLLPLEEPVHFHKDSELELTSITHKV